MALMDENGLGPQPCKSSEAEAAARASRSRTVGGWRHRAHEQLEVAEVNGGQELEICRQRSVAGKREDMLHERETETGQGGGPIHN